MHGSMTEAQLIDLAIDPDQRERYHLLLGNPKKRAKLLDKLNHSVPLYPARTTIYRKFAEAVAAAGVPPRALVYLMSDIKGLDRQTLPFADAVARMVEAGWEHWWGCRKTWLSITVSATSVRL